MALMEVYCGKSLFPLELPDMWEIVEAPMPDDTPIADPAEKVREKLCCPSGSAPLAEIVSPGDTIAICVTDISRPCPEYLLLPPLLKELESAGIRREDVTILIGVGEHRPMTPAEMAEKYGAAVVANYTVINHNARDRENLTFITRTPEGAPCTVNSLLTKVDHIISIGGVDLHAYAGFAGGAKTIAVGCAGEETIAYTHQARFLEETKAAAGFYRGNGFQETLWKIVEELPFRFCINVLMGDGGRIIALDAGNPRVVHGNMVRKGEELFVYTLDAPCEIAFAGVPHPKDINLYQATRGASMHIPSPSPALLPGSVINLICSCPEGFGGGTGESRFRQRMMQHSSPKEIVDTLLQEGNLPGEQRAYMVARTMQTNPINIFGPDIDADELRSAQFLVQPFFTEEQKKQKLRALVMKDGTKKVVRCK